ncbi:glycosyltransferase family 1 protein [Phanerochaete sordida]|uniref:Glycosyltransferase family 1 protein n=1 Tax=Phanerochaete sordida TaxID=48140 RepID=A0A9P3LFL3_9APHY|nr:glycosyltransferase family 1 protein [Phanerochaete sordida]
MTIARSLHIAIVVHLGWGHARPLCALAARLVKLRSVDITFLTACDMHGKVLKELARSFEDGEDALRARIRVVGLLAHTADMFDREVVGESFEEQFSKILVGEPAFCSATQSSVPPLKVPDALIVDMFGDLFFEIARRHSATLKILVSLPSALFCVYALTGPYGPDGLDALNAAVEDVMRKTGKTLPEAARELLGRPTDDVVRIPGVPEMYAYENSPQELSFDLPNIGYIHLTAANLVHACDGLISASMPALEPPATVQAFNAFLASQSRKLYFLGLLLPETRREAQAERTQLAQAPEIAGFMQRVRRTHGERAMLYISFGTVFWPKNPDRIWAFLDVLIEQNIPFIMAHASPFCALPDEIAAKVKASGIGLITPWAPQQAILEHPATGWFVTHGGFNSVTEAVHAGVPMYAAPPPPLIPTHH